MVNGLFERVSDSLGLSGYFNYMVDEPGKSLLLDSYSGVSDQVARDHAPPVQSSRERHGGRVPSTYRRRGHPNSEDPKVQLGKGIGIQACFCNPLLAGDRLLGTLSFTLSDREHFDEHELDFLKPSAITSPWRRSRRGT